MQFLPHDNLPYVYAIIRTQSNIRNNCDALPVEDNMAIKQIYSFIDFYVSVVKILIWNTPWYLVEFSSVLQTKNFWVF